MAQAVADEYKSSLADLNFNSKPHINMLTMLAEENVRHASTIVKSILDHIEQSSSDLKLPGLYLVDSIIKNVGKQYLTLFSQHLVSLFASVFEKVDESTRSMMFKLRQTWSDLLPNKILYGLDLQVRKLDPAWPITAKPSSKSIHVNPKFLERAAQEKEKSATDVLGESTAFTITNMTSSTFKKDFTAVKLNHGAVLKQVLEKKNQLMEKKAQLRHLELKKIEMATRRKINRIMPSSPYSQNFKPNVLRDPRMVKINKESQSTCLKPGISSVSFHKTAPTSDNFLQKEEKKNVQLEVSEASQKVTQTDRNVSTTQPKTDVVKFVPKPAVVISAEAVSDNMNANNATKEKSGTTSDKSNSSYQEKKNISNKKIFKDNIVSFDVNSRNSAKVYQVSSSQFKQNNNCSENEMVLHSAVNKNTSVGVKPLNDQPEIPPKIIHPSNASITESTSNSDNTKSELDATLSLFKEDPKLASADVIDKTFDTGHQLNESITDSVNAFSEQEVNCKSQKRKCDFTEVKNDQNEPPIKKLSAASKPDSSDYSLHDSPVLFGNKDQDHRRPKLEIIDPNVKGWAQYKAVHPDEFRSPVPTFRGNEGRLRLRRFPSSDFERFHPFDRDRFVHNRLQRGRFNARYGGRHTQFMRGSRGRSRASNIRSLMHDPCKIFEQAKEKYLNGELSKDSYLNLCHRLQSMLDSYDQRCSLLEFCCGLQIMLESYVHQHYDQVSQMHSQTEASLNSELKFQKHHVGYEKTTLFGDFCKDREKLAKLISMGYEKTEIDNSDFWKENIVLVA